MEGLFVYLDLLGFSNYVRTDLIGAARMLESQRDILNVGLSDAAWYQSHGATPDTFQAEHLTTSFHHFLPFSDSLCIASTQPDLFLPQLANFLISAFGFTGHHYEQNQTGRPPENLDIPVIGLGGITYERQNWFPVLWRGGMSAGRFERVGSHGIIDDVRIDTPLLIGDAVVRAVKMEKPGNDENLRKGPRLFCDPLVRAAVTDARLHAFLVPVPGIADCEEFLWPAFLFHSSAHPEYELFKLHELLGPAVALLRSKMGTAVESHYLEFVRLLCRSALSWAVANGLGEMQAREVIVRLLGNENANDLNTRVFVPPPSEAS